MSTACAPLGGAAIRGLQITLELSAVEQPGQGVTKGKLVSPAFSFYPSSHFASQR